MHKFYEIIGCFNAKYAYAGTELVRRCQGLQKLWENTVAMRKPHNAFLLNFPRKTVRLVLKGELSISKNY